MLWLRGLVDEFLPVVLFFVGDMLFSFTIGVIVMMIAIIAILTINLVSGRRIPVFGVASTVAVLLFAGASIVFGEANYFIISDTILDGIFALLLLISLRFKKPLLQTLFEHAFAITDRAWRILTVRWAILFLVLATINEIIRLNFSEDVWVNYKLSTVFIILVFGCYQFTLSMRERLPGESNRLGLRTKKSEFQNIS